MQIKRHLVTTSDERTWKSDSPILFLGEWCRLYDRRAIWGEIDGEVAAPFGLEAEQKSTDAEYVKTLSAVLLIELTGVLNACHNTSHTPRYWNILLGHWLQRYVAVCFNRYFTIEQALLRYKIAGSTIFSSADGFLATPDSLSFIRACDDDVWNNILYARVLQHIAFKDIKLDLVYIKHKDSFKQEQNSETVHRFSIKQLIKAIGSYIVPWLSKNSDAFIVNSYLPKLQEIKLQLSLGQCPQLWESPVLNSVSVNIEMRRALIINSQPHVGFQQFIRDLLPDVIPACYLEGYVDLGQQVESLPWPNKPKFIFTSNNFDTDEVFKAWTGLKVEQGVPYFTGQHGNYQAWSSLLNSPEMVSCDKFFTWGWANENTKNIPAFVFTIANRPRKSKSDGGLLLIELSATQLLYSEDRYYDFGIYQEQQFCFVEALPEKIKHKLTVRLHGAWRGMRWSDDKRWGDRMPSVHLEVGVAPIQTLIQKSRLVVHSYDSTGTLESLASNIPTLCFWNDGLNDLPPAAKPFYELLREAGILADSPEHAALLVGQYWDDIDGWWKSEKVQNARRTFCEQYARVEKDPVHVLKRLLQAAVLNQNDQKNNAK